DLAATALAASAPPGPAAMALPQSAAAAMDVPSPSWSRDHLVALHNGRSEMLEGRGRLRQALDERRIALTIDPNHRAGEQASQRPAAQISRQVGELATEGRAALDRGLLSEARQRFLAALALDPTSRLAFEPLQTEVREVTFIIHIVRLGETLASIADLY